MDPTAIAIVTIGAGFLVLFWHTGNGVRAAIRDRRSTEAWTLTAMAAGDTGSAALCADGSSGGHGGADGGSCGADGGGGGHC